MKFVLYVIILTIIACGKKDYLQNEFKNSDFYKTGKFGDEFPEFHEEELNQFHNLLKDFIKDPGNLELFKKIKEFLKLFQSKEEVLSLIENLEMEKQYKTPLSFLLSVAYCSLDQLEKAISFYSKDNLNKFSHLKTAENLFKQNKELSSFFDYKFEKNEPFENYMKQFENDYKEAVQVNIVEYFKKQFPEALIGETDTAIFIDLKRVKRVMEIKNQFLLVKKNLFLEANELLFDMNSGIHNVNGKNIFIDVEYFKNGIFITSDMRKWGKAKNGQDGRDAQEQGFSCTKAIAGANGVNGKNGIPGGDVYINSKVSPNSKCFPDFCRSKVILSGGYGQAGGNGGRGGNGLVTRPKERDFLSIKENFRTFSSNYSQPAIGGKGGIGGRGGSAGELFVQGEHFSINSLMIYADKGTDGADGKDGESGKLVRK